MPEAGGLYELPQGPATIEERSDRPGAERSIQVALRKAELGSIIELWDELYVENIVIEPNRGRTAVTLQAAPGKKIVWRSDGATEPDAAHHQTLSTRPIFTNCWNRHHAGQGAMSKAVSSTI